MLLNRFFGIVSLVVFVACAGLHVATYVPSVALEYNRFEPLFILTMIVFIPTVIIGAIEQWRNRREYPKGILAQQREAMREMRNFFALLRSTLPLPLLIACVVVFVYVFADFYWLMNVFEEGRHAYDEEGYFLIRDGDRVREITREEYQRFETLQVRLISGHSLPFSLIPAVYFLVWRTREAGGGRSSV